GRMGMFGAGIDLQIAHLLAAQGTARDHALHGLLDDALGEAAFEKLAGGALLDAARIARMPVIDLVAELLAGQLDLLGIDDDHVVAAIAMRRVDRLVLAAQAVGDERGQTAEHHAFSVDQKPLLLDLGRFRRAGFHELRSSVFGGPGKRASYGLEYA